MPHYEKKVFIVIREREYPEAFGKVHSREKEKQTRHDQGVGKQESGRE